MNHRIALLTNFLPPYRLAVLRELEKRCESLRIFVSTPIEDGSRMVSSQSGLGVFEQRSVQWLETQRHTHYFTERLAIQFPYDTVAQLRKFRPDVVVSG